MTGRDGKAILRPSIQRGAAGLLTTLGPHIAQAEGAFASKCGWTPNPAAHVSGDAETAAIAARPCRQGDRVPVSAVSVAVKKLDLDQIAFFEGIDDPLLPICRSAECLLKRTCQSRSAMSAFGGKADTGGLGSLLPN